MIAEKRPWGNYSVLHIEPGFQVKRVQIDPGFRLSLQKHAHRSENWFVVAGQGVATLGDREIRVSCGSFLQVEKGQLHRMASSGDKPLVFIEVQLGEYLAEDDIIRIQDDFGRI